MAFPTDAQPGPPIYADAALRRALHFDEHDLDANRRGLLTERQRGLLRREASGLQARFRLFAILFGLVGFMAVNRLLAPADLVDVCLAGWSALVFGGGSFLMVEAMTDSRSPLRAALQAGRVQMVHGRVSCRVAGLDRKVYELVIGDQAFRVPRAVWKAFDDGRRYRLHYAPYALTLLSAEPLE